MTWRAAFLLAFGVISTAPAIADSRMGSAPLANVQLEDPAKERAAKQLMETVRCLVCQGQSIADSDAEMAGDMRALIRERIQKGDSPETIRKWLIERYGDWVSYAPPSHGAGLLLWTIPAILLILGLIVASGRFRMKRR